MLSNTKCSFPMYTRVIVLSITLFLLFGCQDAPLPASPIQVHGETGALTNLTEIFFDANLTPLDNNQAKLDSYYLTATVYIPVCGYVGGVEVFVYSEGKLIYKKDGMQKAVIAQPIPVLSVLPSFDIKQTFVPESTIIVTRGDAYIELVYFTEVGNLHKVGPTETCEYMISSPPDFSPNTGSINFGPGVPSTPLFSSGTLRINIPLESENPSPVTSTPTSTLQDCESPNISDLKFMPSSPAVIDTVVDITGTADWNPCFRSMRLKIDDVIVYELGLPSFTYSWDTSSFTPGEHTITLEVAAQGDNSWSAPSVREVNFSLERGVSALTPTPISYELPPLNGQDYYSVLQWIKYAMANNDISVFEKLLTKGVSYASYIEGGDPATRNEFLEDLAKRLPSGPHCDSFSFGYDVLYIWSSGWSPGWVMDQLCHVGCDQIVPPNTSDVIAFALLNDGSGWHIDFIPFGERPDWWANAYRAQIISCDTVQISPGITSAPASSDFPPFNPAEYFSVLQWIKYATLNNTISVFEELIVGNSIQLIDGNNKIVTINKADFLAELSARLTSQPDCEFFMFEESGRLVVRISNWSPGWGVDGSTIVYLILEMRNNQWVLTSIIYGDYLPSWAQGLERISYDTISLSVGNTTETACQEARPTRLKDGDFAFVSFYPPLNQRVRSGFGVQNEKLDSLPPGTTVKIIDGPECADNYLWWKVKVMNSGLQGWIAEGDKDAYWLIPCESRNNCGTR